MFDYQAGEKYRLTLMMVAVAGLLRVFFTLLLMPTPAPERKAAAYQKWMSDPDVAGGNSPYGRPQSGPSARMADAAAPPQAPQTDPDLAKNMIVQWLPLAWDLSATTARTSQERAISCMAPDVAETYRKNVWTSGLAKQIESSGVKSSFRADRVLVGGSQADGAVIVFVDGMQTLDVPGKGEKARPVKLEYMVKNMSGSLKIVGISEGGQSS